MGKASDDPATAILRARIEKLARRARAIILARRASEDPSRDDSLFIQTIGEIYYVTRADFLANAEDCYVFAIRVRPVIVVSERGFVEGLLSSNRNANV